MPAKRTRRRDVTLSDVAKRASVSSATVSYVFNGTGSVSVETREHVLSIVKEMGYRPSSGRRAAHANAPVIGKATDQIALLQDPRLYEELAKSDFYMRTTLGVQKALGERGKHVILVKVEGDADELPTAIVRGHVEGAISMSPLPIGVLQRINAVVPLVLLNTRVDGSGLSHVMPDDAGGVQAAVSHVRELGHRRIAYFAIHDSDPINPHHATRAAAFEEIANRSAGGGGWMRSTVLASRTKSLNETVADTLRAWRAAGQMPTAVICAADTYAFAFEEAAADLGIEVPRDLSLVGMDDCMFCENSRPPLTSVRQPLEAMSREAVNLLMERTNDPERSPISSTRIFGVDLICRASCAPPI